MNDTYIIEYRNGVVSNDWVACDSAETYKEAKSLRYQNVRKNHLREYQIVCGDVVMPDAFYHLLT